MCEAWRGSTTASYVRSVHLKPIVYVTDMAASTAWYEALLAGEPTMVSEHWTTFDCGGATLALHLTDEDLGPGGVELSLVAEAPLETAHARCAGAAEIIEQPFGRSFTVTDPDGTVIQVNEH